MAEYKRSVQGGPQLIAFASGKGGVGKSLAVANVGIFLATLGRRVVILDCAFGAPNVHLFVGVPRPMYTLSALAAGASLEALVVDTPIANLRFVGATHDPDWMANPAPDFVDRLIAQARTLAADYVLIDLAGGMAATTLALFTGADRGVVVAMPEPSSIELAHRFVRAAFLVRVRRAGLGHLIDQPAAEQHPWPMEGIPSALELYLRVLPQGGSHPDVVALRKAILGFAPGWVMNAVRSKADMELGRAITTAARRRLGVPIQFLGHLEYDEAVWASTRRRRPLLIEHPETRIAKCFERVSRSLVGQRPSERFAYDNDVLPSESHYELLDVPPTASFEDLRRANRRIRDIYGTESVAISGLYDPASLEAVHRRLDLAYATLMDAAKRKEYDRLLFPDGVPLPVAPHTEPPLAERVDPRGPDPIEHVRPPLPAIDAKTVFDGTLLRQLREAQGIELREIAERSKIGMAYLQAIEADAFSRLPAIVYVRGFVAEYARAVVSGVGLDPDVVKDLYLDRYRRAREPVSVDTAR